LRALFLLLLWAGAALAQGVDYPLLFGTHADQVQRPSPGVQVLELPGPVVVTCENGRCFGMDHSAHGAAGCALRMLNSAVAVARHCPSTFTSEEAQRLERALDRGWGFYARNSVPPLDDAARDQMRQSAMRYEIRSLGGACALGQDSLALLKSMASANGANRVARVFETPRLPVMNPCF
jgi:hypothetical protein